MAATKIVGYRPDWADGFRRVGQALRVDAAEQWAASTKWRLPESDT